MDHRLIETIRYVIAIESIMIKRYNENKSTGRGNGGAYQ